MRKTWRMTAGEYRANLNGLNIFFGAVLGVVLAGTDSLGQIDFSIMLAMSAGLVISILLVSSSPYRIPYALLTAALIALLPFLLRNLLHAGAEFPRNLQPTLGVWLAMTLLVEFAPREAAAAAAEPDDA